MKTLHIIRRVDDRVAWEVIRGDSHEGEVSVLLVQDGVYMEDAPMAKVYASSEDVQARGVFTSHSLVTSQQISRLVAEHERTVVW